jgi:hypothetical protein
MLGLFEARTGVLLDVVGCSPQCSFVNIGVFINAG